MIEVTEKASTMIRDIVAGQGLDQEYGLRLSVSSGCSGYKYSLSIALPSNYDETFGPFIGGKVLIDENHVEKLTGTTIDFGDINGSGEYNFEIINPNKPKKSGGCSSGGCSSGGCGGCSSK